MVQRHPFLNHERYKMSNIESPLQRHRLTYEPPLPEGLKDLESLSVEKKEWGADSSIKEVFPHTYGLPFLSFKSEKKIVKFSPLNIGVVFSGGQAPGGENVIAGIFDALQKINPSSKLIGFLEGPEGVIENRFIELTKEIIAPYRNQGGFDLIGSGRTKIETAEQFEGARRTFLHHRLDGFIIIGGDDSNTNAAVLAEYCKEKQLWTRVIGVPKTIDGDLKNQWIETSFGFDTASKVYSEVIGNLAKDALSAKKYTFFVKMMGRSASHLTLECALQTRVNLALIGEEIAEKGQTLNQVIQQITSLICDRSKQKKHYGVILIPEGLLEFIPDCKLLIQELNTLLVDPTKKENISQYLSENANHCFSIFPEEIRAQLLLDRDSHGNVQLSKIETERLLIALVEKELEKRRKEGEYEGKFNPQPLFCGYEGRSALPSNFDCQYCYALGHLAVLLILHEASGYMCCIKRLTAPVEKWEIGGVPLVSMLHFEMRKNKRKAVIQKAMVDLNGKVFARFVDEREKWKLDDVYSSPGPIQFEGPKELTDSLPLTLILEVS